MRAIIALGLAGLTLAVFVQAAGHEFVNLDDPAYVVANAHLRAPLSLETLAQDFTRPFFANWAPLTLVSYHLNHAIHGREFAGYLLTNVALHLLATLLLFAALDRMTGRAWASGFVAAVFAVHPLHVESVAWVSSRKDVLAGVFWMGGLLAYARYAERPAAGRYALVLGCLVAGLMSKSLLVTFPFALLLLDHWPLRRLSRRALLEKLPMLVVVAVFGAVAVWAQRGGDAMAFGEYYEIGFGPRLGNAIDSIAAYLSQTFWPRGLTPHYPHPRHALPPGRVLLGAALLLGVTGATLRTWRTRPYLAVGWLWFLGALLPMLGLVQVGSQARADRYMYVPLVGLAILVAWGVPDLLARRSQPSRLAGWLGAVAVAGLAGVAFVQVGHWRNSETLFSQTLAAEPQSFFGHRGLGLVRIQQGRWEEAEELLEAGWRLRPDMGGPALVRLQLLLAERALRQGDAGVMRARLDRALTVDPEHARANGALGVILVRQGRHAEARPHLERAARSPDARATVHAALADSHFFAGRPREAIRASRAALARDPELDWAANTLAWILATNPDAELRDPAEAVRVAEALVARGDPADANYLDTLAAAYAASGRQQEAVDTALGALARADVEGKEALKRAIHERLERYRNGESLHEP